MSDEIQAESSAFILKSNVLNDSVDIERKKRKIQGSYNDGTTSYSGVLILGGATVERIGDRNVIMETARIPKHSELLGYVYNDEHVISNDSLKNGGIKRLLGDYLSKISPNRINFA